uniref:Uncharacterized protein n=1 Tax=Anas platyrhynchos platyrhynchos TaxID=8840 RepID=A0A493SSS0_ANAPP
MASSAPWLRWAQTELGTGCEELKRWEEEEEEEEEDFGRHMDENGVIGLGDDGLGAVTSRPGSSHFGEAPAGSMDLSDLQDSGSEEWGREDAGSPPSGDGEDLEGSPVEPARWHPRQELTEEEEEEEEGEDEEEEERGSSMEDERLEGPWGAESDGELHPEARPLHKAPGVTTDGGDTSGPSDTSPGPATPPRRRRGWGWAGATHGSRRQGWGPSQSHSAPQNPAGSRAEPDHKPLGSPQTPHQRPRVPEPGRLSRSLSPRRHGGAKKLKETPEGCRYGRGQLNHPLPDLSKVEARVKFDQSYRPPPSRALPARARTPGGPLVPKSPAEIVREVLLSSGEGAPTQPPAPPGVPQELRSPRQATALVQQLQVSLYADPPRASRSAHAGTLGSGCRVMAFSIPRASTATVSTAPNPNPNPAPTPPLSVNGDLGPAEWGMSQRPCSPFSSSGGCPTCVGQCRCLGPQLTRTLAGQTRKLQAQASPGWLWGGEHAPDPPSMERARTPAQPLLPKPGGVLRELAPCRERGAAGAAPAVPAAEGGAGRAGAGVPAGTGGARAAAAAPRSLGGLRPGARGGRGNILPGDAPGGAEGAAGASSAPPGLPAPPAEPGGHRGSPQHPGDIGGRRGGGRGAAPAPLAQAAPSGGGLRGPAGAVSAPHGGLGGQVPAPQTHPLLPAPRRYQHFKSLPASLSLERLSLAGSGSLEEADGPAAGDHGPGQVPCRARSLEEGTDLETSPSPPPPRRAVPLPHRDPLRPEGTRGHHQEPPAAPPAATTGAPRSPATAGAPVPAQQRGGQRCHPAPTPQALPPVVAGAAHGVAGDGQRLRGLGGQPGVPAGAHPRASPPGHRDARLAGTTRPHPRTSPSNAAEGCAAAAPREEAVGHLPVPWARAPPGQR